MAVQGSRRRQKTWSLLGDVKKRVTEYEAVTAMFHYHFRREPAPFELDPDQTLNVWYKTHREGSDFQVDDWEDYRDPARHTYRSYVAQQKEREIYLEGVVDEYEAAGGDSELSSEWAGVLQRLTLPARFAFHTMQMASMYVGQMAPSAYITNAAHFQGADEVRRIQWYAYRAKSLSLDHGDGFADSDAARAAFESDEAWQPLREAVEKMLIAYDWGEAYAALNLVIKPAVDAVFNTQLGALAAANGDELGARFGAEFNRDADRSKDWVSALSQYAIGREAGHKDLLKGWVDKWTPLAHSAVEGLATLFEGAPSPMAASDVTAAVGAAHEAFIDRCGLA